MRLRGRLRLMARRFTRELRLAAALADGYERLTVEDRWGLLGWLCDEAGARRCCRESRDLVQSICRESRDLVQSMHPRRQTARKAKPPHPGTHPRTRADRAPGRQVRLWQCGLRWSSGWRSARCSTTSRWAPAPRLFADRVSSDPVSLWSLCLFGSAASSGASEAPGARASAALSSAEPTTPARRAPQVQEKLLVNRQVMDAMEPPMQRVLTAVGPPLPPPSVQIGQARRHSVQIGRTPPPPPVTNRTHMYPPHRTKWTRISPHARASFSPTPS